VSEDGYIEGAPELVAEIATSSASIDLGTKRQVYRRNGVQEYMVWKTFEKELAWFRLVEGEYRQLEADENGLIKSQIMPGLWLAVDALLSSRMFEVLNVSQTGVASPEHAAFVQKLANS
jgi:Uma2 family endonuclease